MGLRIRGIYATALTRFFYEHNFSIVDPSRQIRKRFQDCSNIDSAEPTTLEIRDRRDGQGILLSGEPDRLNKALKLLNENFFDVVCRKRKGTAGNLVDIEFPYCTKKVLDELRNKVVPTVPNHHRLRVIAPRFVDLMEKKQLAIHPDKRQRAGEDMERSLIWGFLRKGREVAIEHVKLDGRVLSLSEGEILEASWKEKRLVLKRSKFKGRSNYDGLAVPKAEGDYAVSEVTEGDWVYRHSYYRRDGRLIGQYYNINTPVEFYPDRIRYIDLEVDLIRWPEGNTEIVEKALLARQLDAGRINQALEEKAAAVAEELKEKIAPFNLRR